MPIYEYRCSECEHRFEMLQRIGQGAEGLVCPSCGGTSLDKQFSTFAAATGTGDTQLWTEGCGGACSCAAGAGARSH